MNGPKELESLDDYTARMASELASEREAGQEQGDDPPGDFEPPNVFVPGYGWCVV